VKKKIKNTFLLTAIFFSAVINAAQLQGKVIRVLDGDTIEVLHDNESVRIRLANIDAPERMQPYGRWSTSQLKSLVAGKQVTVSYTQSDRYGRVLGLVETKYVNVNRAQVISGAAWVYDQYSADTALPALQKEAQTQKRGLWADSEPVPPWEWRHKNKVKENVNINHL